MERHHGDDARGEPTSFRRAQSCGAIWPNASEGTRSGKIILTASLEAEAQLPQELFRPNPPARLLSRRIERSYDLRYRASQCSTAERLNRRYCHCRRQI